MSQPHASDARAQALKTSMEAQLAALSDENAKLRQLIADRGLGDLWAERVKSAADAGESWAKAADADGSKGSEAGSDAARDGAPVFPAKHSRYAPPVEGALRMDGPDGSKTARHSAGDAESNPSSAEFGSMFSQLASDDIELLTTINETQPHFIITDPNIPDSMCHLTRCCCCRCFTSSLPLPPQTRSSSLRLASLS